MNTTQVAIEILYKTVTDARNETLRLKQALDNLKNERIDINVEHGHITQRINDINASIRSLQDEAAIARELLKLDPKDDAVKKNLQDVKLQLVDLNAYLNEYKRALDLVNERAEANSVQQAKARQAVKEATDRQTEAEKTYNAAVKQTEADEKAAKKAEEEATKRAEEEKRRQREQTAEVVRRIAREAEEAAEREREAFEQFNDELERTEAIAGRIGDLFKAIGTVSGWTAEFADSIGNAFSGMSGIFDTDIGKYATASLTHQFMQRLVGNTSNVVSRYDILNTFVPYMAISGVNATAATAAQQRVDQSIRGLPLGLDEATQRLRRYFMYTGDLDYATNLAIGVQQAIVAGGSGQSYQTQAYNMIERMLATGDLTNIRQWQALLVGLGVSQRFVEEELGVERGTLMQAIKSNTIEVEDFLGAIARLGSGTTAAAKEMQSALDIYKSTITSWLSNIEFAVTRGNANILSAVDQTLEKVTGTGITGYLENWRDTENDIFSWVGDYIRKNPEQVASIVGYAQQLLSALSRFSASDTIGYVVKYLGDLVGMITTFAKALPEGQMEKFTAFATSMAGTLGKIFDAAGKYPFMAAVFERFQDFDWNMFAEDLASVAGSLERIIAALLQKIPDETMSKLLAFGLVFGKPVQGVMNGIGNGIKTGAGLWTQFALWRHLRGQGTQGVTSDSLLNMASAFEGGNWFTNSLGASTFGGLLPGLLGGLIIPSTIMTIIASALSNRRISAIESGYTGSTSDLLAEISLLKTAGAFDEYGNARVGYESDYERLTALQRVLAQRRKWEEQNFQGTMYPAGRGYESHGVYNFADDLNKVTAGVATITSAIDVQALTIKSSLVTQLYEAQKAYQSLYDSARESLEGQISLWEKFTLNEDVHYVAEGKGNSKANMEYNTGIVERYADAVTYLSDYVEKHPEAAGYIGQMVGTMDIADLATIENLVAYIQAGKDLPLDAWNALAEAIDRASDALARWKELNAEKEYTKDEATGIIQQIFGDDPDVLERFDEIWGDLEKTTESGMKTFKDTIYEYLSETKKVTQKQIEDIDGAFHTISSSKTWMYDTMKGLMLALKAGIVDCGDEAVREAWRIHMGIQNALSGFEIQLGRMTNYSDYDDVVWNLEHPGQTRASGGLIYAANGRLIAFEPRGTDTVPAMLTPGEFVMRKQAVDTFGAAFMKSINDLNIGAAFDRLINTKLSNPRGFVNNTYNTRDDHSTHIQNIKTNNPYFASRRAGRFVRAMA